MTRLEQEIQQTKPFASLCQETALSLLRTADVIQRVYSEAMVTFDITFQQYNVLRVVRGAGEEGIATSLIGERMIEQNPGVTRLIDRLERKKLLIRYRSEADRRVVTCHISRKGLDLLNRMQATIDKTEVSMMARLNNEQLHTINNLLTELRKGKSHHV